MDASYHRYDINNKVWELLDNVIKLRIFRTRKKAHHLFYKERVVGIS